MLGFGATRRILQSEPSSRFSDGAKHGSLVARLLGSTSSVEAGPPETSAYSPGQIHVVHVWRDGYTEPQSMTLIDPETGVETGDIVMPGQGIYSAGVDWAMGVAVLVFQGEPGFVGTATPVKWRLEMEGRVIESTYTATVVGDEVPAEPVEVTPGTPTKSDDYGTADDTFDIPNTEGVKYSANGEVIGAGLHPASGTVHVTAEAQPGYKLSGTTSWTLEFTDVPAPQAFPLPPATSSGPSGEMQRTSGPLPGQADMHTDIRFYDARTDSWVHSLTVDNVGEYFASRSDTEYLLYFVPAAGFTGGPVEPVPFRVTFQGETVESTYTANVKASEPMRVTAQAPTQVDDWGTGHDTVKLNRLGRALAARPNGVAVTLKATVTGTDKKGYQTSGRARVVAPKVELRPIYFGTDSARLSSGDRAYLLKVRRQLGDVTSVVCTGYADARSTVRYNAALGKARAKAVCDVLTKGVTAKVSTVSRGEARPVASDKTRDGRALNRRVEVDLKY